MQDRTHGMMSRAAGATAAGAALLLAALVGTGMANAGQTSHLAHDRPVVRQAESSTWPGMSAGSSSPADIELADLLIRDLPVKVQAGEGFAARVAVPSGASCSGTIAYPNRPAQPLDEAGARAGACAWELIVPYETRRVFVYRPDAPVEQLDDPATVSGDPVLPGFILNLREVW